MSCKSLTSFHTLIDDSKRFNLHDVLLASINNEAMGIPTKDKYVIQKQKSLVL